MTEETGLAAEELPDLRGKVLVDALERLQPGDERLAGLDVNELAAAADPAEFGKDDFRRLLAALVRLGEQVPELDFGRIEPRHFANLVAKASKAQLEKVLGERALRTRLLDEIFARMSGHIRSSRARDTHAVVHWRLTGGSGEGGFDRYETIISDGRCTAGRERTEKPRVTITIGPGDFFRLITHQATPAVLFVTGKIKVKGDLAFAAGLIGFFDLPRPD
jgi:putative sterol carrier protein